MAFGLTLDQLIQLGLLAATVVPLVVVSAKVMYTRKAGLRVIINPVRSAAAYVLRVAQEEGERPYVATAGVWCELLLINNSKDAVTILGLAGGDPLSAPKNCVSPYFLGVADTRARVSLTQTLQPPFQISPRNVCKLFAICPVKLPKEIGQHLTSVASRGMLAKRPVDPMASISRMLQEVANKVSGDLPDSVRIRAVIAQAVSFEDPLFRVSGNEVIVDPMFGEINGTALSSFHIESLRRIDLRAIHSPSTLYRVSATLADGRVFYGQLDTAGFPLWFLSDPRAR